MARKHDIKMIAAWARDWGITGYEHYDPKEREKRKQNANRDNRKRKEDSFYQKRYK